MRLDLAILNGTVVDEHGQHPLDIGIADGRVALLVNRGGLPELPTQTIDASGQWVLPGVVDAHFHCRAPDHPEREDFASGTAAAAAGGVTTLFEMPLADVGVASAAVLTSRHKLAASQAHVDFGLFGAPGSGDQATIDGLAAAGAIGFKIFTLRPPPGRAAAFDGISVISEAAIYQALEQVGRTGLVCAFHAENDALLELGRQRASGAHLSEVQRYLAGHPPSAEALAVAWVVVLAEATGAHAHIVHVTSAWALDLIRLARQRGVRLTAETCPQYLLFTEADVERAGPWAKVAPPFRSAQDQAALWQALADGTLDFIASDHAPFRAAEKLEPPLNTAPSGLPLVEAMVPLMLSAAIEGRLPLERMVALLTAAPARVYGVYPQKGSLAPGADADVLIYDPRAQSTLDITRWHSRSRESARIVHGTRYHGRVVRTIVRGRTVYHNGELIGEPGWGQLVRPARA